MENTTIDKISMHQISSLEKVYLDYTPHEEEFDKLTVLRNEKFSYQIAYKGNKHHARHDMKIEVISQLKEFVTVRLVGNVPCETPIRIESDEYYEKYEPGLFPDVLYPIENDTVEMIWSAWHSLWVSVELDGSVKPGEYTIEIKASDETLTESKIFTVTVLDALLPEQDMIFTQWFHADCLADYYKVPVFSDEHWRRIDQFMNTAVKNGINMILTPIFTPPLDTDVGRERTTVQLVGVIKNGNDYSFNFDNFRKWVALCKKNGFKYYEMAHLFSQWGLEYAPKIMATVDGEEKRIFGWDVASDDERYISFLKEFLPALSSVLKEERINDCTFFHISDEPAIEHLERYKYLKSIINTIIPEYKIIDALSKFEFYKQGVVDYPVPATNHIDDFIEGGVSTLWSYYCCSQHLEVSNRFMAMPSYRNRIIGLQFYKFNVVGFLHWGYNFYNSALSKKKINPFLITDCIGTYQGGDAFSVYPGDDGPIESLRLLVFYEALQDVRALKLLESFIGKENVVKIIEDEAGMEIKFNKYPHSKEFMLNVRDRIYKEIAKHL